MQYSVLVLLVFFLLLACKNDPGEKTPASTLDNMEEQTKLRYLKEIEWPQAYREQDTVLLDRILGDDFQMVSADGTWSDKAGQMARIKAAPMDNDFFEFEIKRLEVHENGTAIVAGTGHVITNGEEMTYQSSNVLIKRGDYWKAVLSHVSGITELSDIHSHHSIALPKEVDFSYLVGDWKRTNEAAGKETHEHWKKNSDTEYTGLGYTLAAGDTVWKESIRLVREKDQWLFKVIGNRDSIATTFKVTKADSYSFECFNPENTFPNTIRYVNERDSLFATISDGETEIDFIFAKVRL